MFVERTVLSPTSNPGPNSQDNTMIVEMGTHKTVVMQNNRRQVIRHNPPRHWRDVLTQYGEFAQFDLTGTTWLKIR